MCHRCRRAAQSKHPAARPLTRRPRPEGLTQEQAEELYLRVMRWQTVLKRFGVGV